MKYFVLINFSPFVNPVGGPRKLNFKIPRIVSSPVLDEKITEINSKTKHHNALNEIKLCRLADYILLVYNCYYQEDLIFYSVNEQAFKEKIHVILFQKFSTSLVRVNGEP